MHKNVVWNTGSAAGRFRRNRRLILENRKRKSYKPQATSHKKQPQLKDKIKYEKIQNRS